MKRGSNTLAIMKRFLSTMRAMTINEIKKPLTLQRLPVPQLQKANDVLVRVHSCAVCHRDVLDKNGAFPFLKPNTITGHEIAGVVERTGDAVGALKAGDRIVTLHWGPCGRCAACRKGETTVCEKRAESFLGLTLNGGYADYCLLPESACVKIPNESRLSLSEASTVMCTYGTVFHSLFKRGRLQSNERLLVTGSGGVATAAIQMATKFGCSVVAATTNQAKVDYLKQLGAAHVIVGSPFDMARDANLRATPVDVVLEAVGEPYLNASLRSLRPGGRLVLVGNVTNAKASFGIGLMIINELEIIGGDSITKEELLETFAFLERHDIRPHIDRTCALEDANQAQALLVAQQSKGRVVLDLQTTTTTTTKIEIINDGAR